jgi:TolA-binding protein
LDELEQKVMERDEAFNLLELEEQILKEKEDHYIHLRSLKKQENAARERMEQNRQRVLTLRNLTDAEEAASEEKLHFIMEHEKNRNFKQIAR